MTIKEKIQNSIDTNDVLETCNSSSKSGLVSVVPHPYPSWVVELNPPPFPSLYLSKISIPLFLS